MIGLVILAAGSSQRLGKPKQLLQFRGGSLLQHAINAATASTCSPVVVVMGSNRESILHQLSPGDYYVVQNTKWESGIASSVKAGLQKLLELNASPDAVVFMVADQPLVTENTINDLVKQYRKDGKQIIASAYHDTVGVPALFGSGYFLQLFSLNGDEGAKKLVMQNESDVIAISFEQGAIDIDTPQDEERLRLL